MKHSIGKTLTGSTLTEIFTVPEGYVAEVDMLFVNNQTSGSKNIDVYWQKASNPSEQIYILFEKPLSSKEFLQFSNGVVVFKPGDSMWAKAEVGSDYTLIVTFDLKTAPALYTFPTE